MFKKVVVQMTEPICHCEEQNIGWSVLQSQVGPSLVVWCNTCRVRVEIPNKEFKAMFHFEKPYPGKPKPAVEVIERKPGDVIDFTEYLKKKRPGEVPS